MEPRQQLHLDVTGEVQGVGFRVGLFREAQGLDVTGWVRNGADGRVEVLLQGSSAELALLEAWCHRGPRYARVETVIARWETLEEYYTAFEIW